MALARFATEAARQSFVANLVARGYKLAPPPTPGLLRGLKIGQFRVYDYHRKGQRDELRVSYWLSVQGPRLDVPIPTTHVGGATCTTPGHEHKKAHARGLCSGCYQRWNYWTNAERRKRKRLLCRRMKERRARLRAEREAAAHVHSASTFAPDEQATGVNIDEDQPQVAEALLEAVTGRKPSWKRAQ